MSGLTALVIALAAGIVAVAVVVLWAAIGHAAYLIRAERQAKGIELSPTPGRPRLGQTRRPRRGRHRPRP